jgi:hypothetical protein
MSLLRSRTQLLILGSILFLLPGSGSVSSGNKDAETDENALSVSSNITEGAGSAGYRSVTLYNNGFLAAGSEGRIDWLSLSGKITKSLTFPGENFNCILSSYQMIIAAGDSGIIMISADGNTFRKLNSRTDKRLNSITSFNEVILVGADQGEIIIVEREDRVRTIQLPLKGNIVSVSAGISACFGVTDEGEIISSTDGTNWAIINFNEVYSGFYKPCSFSKVLVTDNRIAISGVHNDGSPAVLFSSLGKVWTERTLYYNDNEGSIGILNDVPNDICYDNIEDQFLLACNNGKIMVLPSCTQCNRLIVLSGNDLAGVTCSGNTLMIVGENYFVKSLNIR